MFYDKEIDILNVASSINDYGLETQGEISIIKTIQCDVQPYNKELAYRDYSFEQDVRYRVFCDPEPLLELGTQVQYQEAFKDEKTIFNVVNIVPWDDYWVVLLDD